MLVVEPSNPPLDDDSVRVQRSEHLGDRLPEMAAKLFFQEAYEHLAASDDMAWLHSLQHENDVGMDDLAQLLERVLPEELEVALARRSLSTIPPALSPRCNGVCAAG